MGAANALTRALIVDHHQMFGGFLASFVDDTPDIRIVDLVRNGRDGLEAARAHRPDVVLIDELLPDMHGTEAAASIKRELPETKVIMVTDLDNNSVLARAIEAGCSGFVSKDNAAEDVLTAIRATSAGGVFLPDRLVVALTTLRSSRSGAPYDLTVRELEVLNLLARGLAPAAIGIKLFISLNTARNHVHAVLVKLGAHTQLEAVAIALRESIVDTTQLSAADELKASS
jgi:DNA-binding NarL/FixJ family response regulator